VRGAFDCDNPEGAAQTQVRRGLAGEAHHRIPDHAGRQRRRRDPPRRTVLSGIRQTKDEPAARLGWNRANST
jgi:hypothetical protein